MKENKGNNSFSRESVLRILYLLCCAIAAIIAVLTFIGNFMNGEATNNFAIIAMVYFLVAMLVQTFFPGRNAKWYIIAGSFFAAMIPTDFFLKQYVMQSGEGSGLSLIAMAVLLGIWMFVNATAKKWSDERRAQGYTFNMLLEKRKGA